MHNSRFINGCITFIEFQVSISCVPRGRCIHNFLIRTTRILESLNLRLILIEPTLLFCMLPFSRKYNLLTRGFSSAKFKGSKNVVTFGLDSSHAKILDEVIIEYFLHF